MIRFAAGATNGEKAKKDLEYKAKSETAKSAWAKPNAQVCGLHETSPMPDVLVVAASRHLPYYCRTDRTQRLSRDGVCTQTAL